VATLRIYYHYRTCSLPALKSLHQTSRASVFPKRASAQDGHWDTECEFCREFIQVFATRRKNCPPGGDDFVGFLGLDASVGVGIEQVVFEDASGIEIKDPSDGLYQGGSAS
jgi:hypothetical protein